ncbi:hypothetical protein LPJ66_001453 [Kickxella alabastrina]|uniref:Uncharacterized protein n=1 Tax=Kickxella alabastrina TaxID=61397 RepID=A0ACC1IT80_9FUNG|nr:hypothetical protein LPJ66_001453 [Kickxella alabastrina]
MSQPNPILEWATQFYCSLDDHEMVDELLCLRDCNTSSSKSAFPSSALSSNDTEAENHDPLCSTGGSQPLYVSFYKLRRALENIGPMCLGLSELDMESSTQLPWESFLHSQRISQLDLSISANIESNNSSNSSSNIEMPIDPFAQSPDNRKRDTLASGHQAKSCDSTSSREPVDIPAAIYSLIAVEKVRRSYVAKLLNTRQSQKSVADQSERWRHKVAKRNIASETQFENTLVALKELVVLQAIASPKYAQSGEIKRCLDYTGNTSGDDDEPDASTALRVETNFDAAQCLTILNMMFPLDALNMGKQGSFGRSEWDHRYAFSLKHVLSPRMQLHQLLCEVEAWINKDNRVTTSMIRRTSIFGDQHLKTLAAGDSDDSQRARNSVCSQSSNNRTPSECPAWLASAQGFAWDQLKQSCLSYLQRAQQNIWEHYEIMRPWLAESNQSTVSATKDDGECFESAQKTLHNSIIRDNNLLLREVNEQLPFGSTVIERIACHSQLVKRRFSSHAVYDALSK